MKTIDIEMAVLDSFWSENCFWYDEFILKMEKKCVLESESNINFCLVNTITYISVN